MKHRMRPRLLPLPALVAIVLAGVAATVEAQDGPDTQPIPRLAADARGAFAGFKQDAAIASGIAVTAPNLATRGFGVVFGAHVYPLRRGVVSLGVGGEMLLSRGSRTLEPATAGAPPGPTVRTRFSSLSPQVSFNFGKRNGWSYISGGIGRSTFTAERQDAPLPDAESGSKTINYGGGARWFVKEHLAFSVDLRFYAVNPAEAAGGRPARPRMTLMVFSAGASFK
jgi:hypothetical protein